MKIIKFNKREYEVTNSCEHARINIDRATRTIRCMVCFELLDPFTTAIEYVDGLDEYKERLDAYREDLIREKARNKLLARKLENRKRTKCSHCDRMTNLKVKEPTLLEIHAEVEGDLV